jgi:predicted phage terminase large subunit-like protein
VTATHLGSTDEDLWLDFVEDGLLGLRGRETQTPEARSWASPGDLAKAIDPSTIQTPALTKIDEALIDVDAGRCDRLIITMPPQEGKTTRIRAGALWMLHRNKQRRIVDVSYGQDLANEFGRDVRSMITGNQGADDTLDLGMRIARDNGSVSSWKLDGYRGGIRSIGIGGGITGRPADVLFIDDPIRNRAQAESEVYRQRAKDFWTSTGSTRLAPGAPVIIILTRWHEDDLAGWLLNRPDGDRWRVINIPAQADHDPAEGGTDPLGREPGEYMDSARIDERTGKQRTPADWEQIKVQAGSRDWEALYQGNPSPPEGGILKRHWWKWYDVPLWRQRDDGSRLVMDYDELLMSWDLTFKDTKGTDFVVGQVWMRRGADAYLLDQVRARMDFVATCDAIRQLTARWPEVLMKLIEDKANGPAVIATLQRTVTGIIPEEPHGSKQARAYAVSPLIEAGNVLLPSPELAPWVADFIEEGAGFPTATHDDQVDAMTQALNRLFLNPLMPDNDLVEAEEYGLIDHRGYYASPV